MNHMHSESAYAQAIKSLSDDDDDGQLCKCRGYLVRAIIAVV